MRSNSRALIIWCAHHIKVFPGPVVPTLLTGLFSSRASTMVSAVASVACDHRNNTALQKVIQAWRLECWLAVRATCESTMLALHGSPGPAIVFWCSTPASLSQLDGRSLQVQMREATQ
jgi:hypothetical protein